MKKFILFAAFVFISIACFSQDIILLKLGTKLEVIVTEITPDLVKYRFFTEPEGRVYFIYKDKIASITHKDGTVETFNQSGKPVVEKKISPTPAPTPTPAPAPTPTPTPAPAPNQSQQTNPVDTNMVNLETKSQLDNNYDRINLFIPIDNKRDIIYLNNGNVIRCAILEQIPGEYIKVEQPDGNIITYQMTDIKKIEKVNIPKRTAAPQSYKPKSPPEINP